MESTPLAAPRPPVDGLAVMNASALQAETTNLTLASDERLATELESLTSWGRVETVLKLGPWETLWRGRTTTHGLVAHSDVPLCVRSNCDILVIEHLVVLKDIMQTFSGIATYRGVTRDYVVALEPSRLGLLSGLIMMAFSYGVAQFDADFPGYSWPVNLTIRDRFNNRILYTKGPYLGSDALSQAAHAEEAVRDRGLQGFLAEQWVSDP